MSPNVHIPTHFDVGVSMKDMYLHGMDSSNHYNILYYPFKFEDDEECDIKTLFQRSDCVFV